MPSNMEGNFAITAAEALKTGKVADTESVIFCSFLASAFWTLGGFFNQLLGAFHVINSGLPFSEW